MAIYTRTGDMGESSLFDGTRVKKYDARLMAYGELDHLNVILGKVKFLVTDSKISGLIKGIQDDILVLSAFLATRDGIKLPEQVRGFDFEAKIRSFEDIIDDITASLPELHSFVLPGKSELELACHESRVLCRKCERLVVELMDMEDGELRIISYLNRLSDLLFTLARKFE